MTDTKDALSSKSTWNFNGIHQVGRHGLRFWRGVLALALTIFLSGGGLAHGAELLDGLKLKFQVALASLDALNEKLDASYTAELEELLDQSQAGGSLEKVLAVKQELAGFKAGETKDAVDFPALARLQKIYRTSADKNVNQRDSERLQLYKKYDKKLVELETTLVRDGKIEEAVKMRAERDRAAKIIEALGTQVENQHEGWQVIFRSSEPRLWNTEVKDERGFARTLPSVPKGIKFLRLRYKNAAVIIPMTYEQLPKLVDVGGGFRWNGAAYLDSRTHRNKKYETVVLGIGSKAMYRKYGHKGGIVTVEKRDGVGRPEGMGGWGFGRTTNMFAGQRYCWEGERCEEESKGEGVVFEISVTSRPLTSAEGRQNLVK